VNLKIPEQYIINKFFQYSGFPVYKPSIRAYNACCPVCKEGHSWGKKKRLFYFPRKEQLYCHNCNKGWSPIGWIKQVCDMSYSEIRAEVLSNTSEKLELDINEVSISNVQQKSETLPRDSINLYDKNQVEYYKSSDVIRKSLHLIKTRLLHKAINKSNALYVSLNDYVHKNRLCIPFYDLSGRIIFYQTRKILNDDSPKYLSKMHEEKSVYGIQNIDVSFPYIFILEGPIDAMFVKNGVAICGTAMTKTQERQLQQFPTHKIIWCLDNQNLDKTSAEKTQKLVSRGEFVFKWPVDIQYKDFNEYCVAENVYQIDTSLILNNTQEGSVFTTLGNISGFKTL
jgi:hypothetical protein